MFFLILLEPGLKFPEENTEKTFQTKQKCPALILKTERVS